MATTNEIPISIRCSANSNVTVPTYSCKRFAEEIIILPDQPAERTISRLNLDLLSQVSDVSRHHVRNAAALQCRDCSATFMYVALLPPIYKSLMYLGNSARKRAAGCGPPTMRLCNTAHRTDN